MNKNREQKERTRTIQDKVISGFNSAYYSLTEPTKLKILRLMHGKEYEKPEKSPLVSVYVPTYNRAELLIERAVSSALNQTYKNLELIIIGDHCTDRTEELVSQIKDKRVRFYNLPKKSSGYPLDAKGRWFAGPVGPANKALQLVKGKWIARIDDDDIFTKNHIEVLLRFAQKHQHEFVSGAHVAERFDKRCIVGAEGGDKRFRVSDKGKNLTIGGPQTWLYRSYLRHFKYNINCWRKSWNCVNDIDFELRLYKAGVRMGFLDRVVAHILPRPGEKTVGLDAYRMAEKKGFKTYYGKK